MNSALAHILGIVGVLQARVGGSKDRGATAVSAAAASSTRYAAVAARASCTRRIVSVGRAA